MSHFYLLALVLSGVLLPVGMMLGLVAIRQEKRLELRIARIKGEHVTPGRAAGTGVRDLVLMVARIGQGMLKSGVVSNQTAKAMENRLHMAGIRSHNGVGMVVAAKAAMVFALPLVAYVLFRNHGMNFKIIIVMIAAIGGLLTPDFVVGRLVKRNQAAILAGLPDTLDMLVMCAESGLSLEPAIVRVGVEIASAHIAIANELQATAREFQMSSDSAAVLGSLGDRTGLKDMKRVSATLIQTLQYGTPLAQALRVLSSEMRQEMLTRFEARAAKLPVLLTVPMVIFILPSLFLVVGGPAVLQAIRLFHHPG